MYDLMAVSAYVHCHHIVSQRCWRRVHHVQGCPHELGEPGAGQVGPVVGIMLDAHSHLRHGEAEQSSARQRQLQVEKSHGSGFVAEKNRILGVAKRAM